MTHLPSRASDSAIRFRALECMLADCDAKWWGWDPQHPPKHSEGCEHLWTEPHTFLAYSQGPGLSPVPIGGIGG